MQQSRESETGVSVGFEKSAGHREAEKGQPSHRNQAGNCFALLSFFLFAPNVTECVCVPRVKFILLCSSNVFSVVAEGYMKLHLCDFSKLGVLKKVKRGKIKV